MKKLTSILLVLSLCTSLYGCSRMGTNIYNGLNNKRLETKSTGLDNTCINWFFIPNNESRTPDINDKLNFKLSDYDATMEDLDNEIKSIVTYLDTKRSLFDFFLFYYLSLNDFITITFYCKRIITFWTFNRMRTLF